MARKKKKSGARTQSAKAPVERTQENAQRGALFSNRPSILFPLYAAVMLSFAVLVGYLMYQSVQAGAAGAPTTKTEARDTQQH